MSDMLLWPIVESMPLFFTSVFFFSDAATTEIYTLSLHDALPIFTSSSSIMSRSMAALRLPCARCHMEFSSRDRKSTRLNSSHITISYAVFCLKKKKSDGDSHDHHCRQAESEPVHELKPRVDRSQQ